MTAVQQDVVIIGAGQAGLAMAALLQREQISYRVLGAELRIGDTWRNRYDSLQLFTPRWLNRLPLDDVPMSEDRNGYPDKNEIADYLERYARRQNLQVTLATQVRSLRRKDEGFVLTTDGGDVTTQAVVIATGPFQQPAIPRFADGLSPTVTQLHTAQYNNPGQLQPGRVLVVGAGNSGAQIAVDLASTYDVHLSVGGPLSFMPQTVLGKSIFWWFNQLGVYRAHVGTRVGQRLSQRPDPVIGRQLKHCLNAGAVTRHPRAVGVRDDQVLFNDDSALQVDNVIWATGFRPDYSWLDIPGTLDETARPDHRRGVTSVAGLYFLGLPWQHSRKSALIGGVGDDAAHLLSFIRAHLRDHAEQPAVPSEQADNPQVAQGC